jgi:heme exporter protein CcmD
MSYVLAGYGITAVAIAGYAGWVLRKGRALSKGKP